MISRDFEFEISVANLLFILRECDCSRGKGLEGKFVYAWDGTELVLLPEVSSDYQNSKKYTELQGQVVYAKELIPGASYQTKKQEILVYLGKFDYHYITGSACIKTAKCKKYVFWNTKNFVFLNDLKSIAVLNSDTVVDNYAELVEKYSKSENGSKIVGLCTRGGKPQTFETRGAGEWVLDNGDGTFIQWDNVYEWQTKQLEYIRQQYKISFKNGALSCARVDGIAYHPAFKQPPKQNYWYSRSQDRKVSWVEPTNLHLYAELENGSKIRLVNGRFYHKGDY